MVFEKKILSDIADLRVGWQSRITPVVLQEGFVRLLQPKDFTENGEIDERRPVFLEGKDLSKVYQIQPFDILFVAKGASNQAFFIPRLAYNSIAGNSFYIVRVKPEIEVNPEYLWWWLNLQESKDYYLREASGSTVSFVSLVTLSRLQVIVPTLLKQDLILKIQKTMKRRSELVREIDMKKVIIANSLCKKLILGKRN